MLGVDGGTSIIAYVSTQRFFYSFLGSKQNSSFPLSFVDISEWLQAILIINTKEVFAQGTKYSSFDRVYTPKFTTHKRDLTDLLA